MKKVESPLHDDKADGDAEELKEHDAHRRPSEALQDSSQEPVVDYFKGPNVTLRQAVAHFSVEQNAVEKERLAEHASSSEKVGSKESITKNGDDVVDDEKTLLFPLRNVYRVRT